MHGPPYPNLWPGTVASVSRANTWRHHSCPIGHGAALVRVNTYYVGKGCGELGVNDSTADVVVRLGNRLAVHDGQRVAQEREDAVTRVRTQCSAVRKSHLLFLVDIPDHADVIGNPALKAQVRLQRSTVKGHITDNSRTWCTLMECSSSSCCGDLTASSRRSCSSTVSFSDAPFGGTKRVRHACETQLLHNPGAVEVLRVEKGLDRCPPLGSVLALVQPVAVRGIIQVQQDARFEQCRLGVLGFSRMTAVAKLVSPSSSWPSEASTRDALAKMRPSILPATCAPTSRPG
jgi:hypothetical protein